MSVALQPLNDYVVAQPQKAEKKTAGGLYIPESAQQKSMIATVVAVGPGKVGDDNDRVPINLKVGDRIIYKGYSTTEVTHAGQEYIILKEDDVLATVK